MVMSNPQPVQLATPHPSIRPPWQQRATPPEASSSLAARRFSSDASACEQHADCRSHRQSHGGATADAIHPVVEISPPDIVSRRSITWHGMTAETVKTTNQVNVEYCFRAPMHLLVAYEEGERRSGETFVEGAPRSSLRNFARKLTFVPAGHAYREWHGPHTRSRRTHFYFDPAKLDSALGIADISFAPRLFFEDATLWDTALKLKSLVDSAGSEDRLYFDALGVVLVHELVRLDGGMSSIPPQLRGGLAAWQERVVAAYIEKHLVEQIPLDTLAQLVRLSRYYFCRAFKQSFGMPPHRYQTSRRMQYAKLLLAKRAVSVTEIGIMLGFSSTSSFTAAFRRESGTTPTDYRRNIG
jgi:AraC family transcriptional regulator